MAKTKIKNHASSHAANLTSDSDTYLELIQRCPLKRIKTKAEHAAASAIVSELMGRKLDSGSSDYLDAQIVFVTMYEDQHEPIGDFNTPQQALTALMKANNLTQANIGKIIGSESAVSMFLSGSRSLSKKQIKALASRFGMDAGLFL